MDDRYTAILANSSIELCVQHQHAYYPERTKAWEPNAQISLLDCAVGQTIDKDETALPADM